MPAIYTFEVTVVETTDGTTDLTIDATLVGEDTIDLLSVSNIDEGAGAIGHLVGEALAGHLGE
jgi:hypothetical protein